MYATLRENVAHMLVLSDAREEALHSLVWDVLGSDDFNLRADEIRRLRQQQETRSFGEALRVVEQGECPVELRPLDRKSRVSQAKTRDRLPELMRALLEPVADVTVTRAEIDLEQSSAGWGKNMGIFGNASQENAVFVPVGVTVDLEGPVNVDHDLFTVQFADSCRAAVAVVAETKVTIAAASIVACVILELGEIMQGTRSKNPDAARVERVRKAAQRVKRLLPHSP